MKCVVSFLHDKYKKKNRNCSSSENNILIKSKVKQRTAFTFLMQFAPIEMFWLMGNESNQTFRGVIFNRLLERSDITEGAEEEYNFVLFVSDGSNFDEEPHWHPCNTSIFFLIP